MTRVVYCSSGPQCQKIFKHAISLHNRPRKKWTTEIEAEVEVDITEEANSKRISIQKLLKQLYKQGNLAVGLLGEEFGKFDYYIIYGTPKVKNLVPK